MSFIKQGFFVHEKELNWQFKEEREKRSEVTSFLSLFFFFFTLFNRWSGTVRDDDDGGGGDGGGESDQASICLKNLFFPLQRQADFGKNFK